MSSRNYFTTSLASGGHRRQPRRRKSDLAKLMTCFHLVKNLIYTEQWNRQRLFAHLVQKTTSELSRLFLGPFNLRELKIDPKLIDCVQWHWHHLQYLIILESIKLLCLSTSQRRKVNIWQLLGQCASRYASCEVPFITRIGQTY